MTEKFGTPMAAQGPAPHDSLRALCEQIKAKNEQWRSLFDADMAQLAAELLGRVDEIVELTRAPDLAAEVSALRQQKDGAYEERNRVVAALARAAVALGWTVAVTRTAIEGWSEDWHGCIYIVTPAGQASWHFHDSHAHLFADLPRGAMAWDGHTTPEKYERLHGMRLAAEAERLRADLDAERRKVEALESRFDFIAHIHRQKAFSERTFGPGPRVAGVVAHIRKELIEVEAAPDDLEEWIDVLMLALDGAWRSGASPEQIVAQLVAKQTKNEGRRWPDWRTVPHGQAIEHDRSGDAALAASDPQRGSEPSTPQTPNPPDQGTSPKAP